MKYQTLVRLYHEINSAVFDELLTVPVILSKRFKDAHGQFINSDGHSRARMEFNPSHIKGLSHASSIVYHEMVHQYLDEILDVEEEDHHGPIFWQYYEYLARSHNFELGEEL